MREPDRRPVEEDVVELVEVELVLEHARGLRRRRPPSRVDPPGDSDPGQAEHDGELLGHIEFFETVGYLDELELSYILYSTEHRGRGIATEAVRLLTGYLFDRTKTNRIRLVIHPGNAPSRRVAEKSGYTLEGVARGAWYHRGRNHDVVVWAILRAEHQPER